MQPIDVASMRSNHLTIGITDCETYILITIFDDETNETASIELSIKSARTLKTYLEVLVDGR